MRLSDLRLSVLVFACLVTSLPAAGQLLISAKSGLIHYTEGDVKIGDQPAAPNNGTFQSLANGRELATGEGRAEMLLGPGQFVRLNENTSVLMVSNKLEATRVDLLRGSMLIEIVDLEKNAPVTLGFGSDTVEVRKAGLYRLDAAESRLRVLEGEAVVHGSGQTLTAKKAKEVSLGAVLAENSFDATTGDEFTRWSMRRAGYVATANVSGARDIYSNGQNWSASNWAYNPWYGMYTYVPSQRMFSSPFGFNYFTPDMAFNDMFWPYIGGGYGYYGMGFGYGYGMPFYGNGYGPGYGYSGYGTGGIGAVGVLTSPKGGAPSRPGYPIGRYPNSPSVRGYGAGGYGRVNTAVGQSAGRATGNGSAGSYRGGGGYSTSGGSSSSSSSRASGGFSGGASMSSGAGRTGGGASSTARGK